MTQNAELIRRRVPDKDSLSKSPRDIGCVRSKQKPRFFNRLSFKNPDYWAQFGHPQCVGETVTPSALYQRDRLHAELSWK